MLSYRVVQDVGRALNPCAIHGQIQGGVVQDWATRCTRKSRSAAMVACARTASRPTACHWPSMSCRSRSTCTKVHRPISPLKDEGRRRGPILNVAATVGCAVANCNRKADPGVATNTAAGARTPPRPKPASLPATHCRGLDRQSAAPAPALAGQIERPKAA